MKFKSALVSQAAGSIGGLTAQGSRGGMVLKARGLTTNRNSTRQNVSRASFAKINQRWVDTLTASQRDGWDVYAANVPRVNKLGDQTNISGKAHYTRSNVIRMNAGLAVVDDAPTEFTLDEPPILTFTSAGAGAQTVTYTYDTAQEWVTEDGAALICQLSNPHNRSATAFRFTFRLLNAVLGDSGSPPPGFVIAPATWRIETNNAYTLKARISRADGRLGYFSRRDGIVSV